MWIRQSNAGRPTEHSALVAGGRRVALNIPIVFVLLTVLLMSAFPAHSESPAPTDEEDFNFRQHGQPTTVFDWATTNLLSAAQIALVNKRAQYLIESPAKMDIQSISTDVVALNNNNVSYMKYTSGHADTLVVRTERDERAFLHSTSHPAAMCGYGDATGVDIRWLPDRRQDYAECSGTNRIANYRVYRKESNGLLTLLADIGVPADSTQAVALRDVPPSSGAWLYFVNSLLPIQVPAQEVFLDSLTIRFPVGGSSGDFFWVDHIRQTNPTFTVEDSVTFANAELRVTLGAKHDGVVPHDIACTITCPDGVTLSTPQVMSGTRLPSGAFSYALPPAPLIKYYPAHGGFAVSFYDNTTHTSLFAGRKLTTNPNNRLRTVAFPEYVMNRLSDTWQTAWAVESTRLLSSGGARSYDGIYLDSCDADMARTSALRAEYNNTAYRASLDSMLASVSDWAANNGGALTMANALGTGAYASYQGLTRVDAISLEGFAYRTWYGSFVLGTSWEEQVYNLWQASQLSNVQTVNALCEVPADSCDTRLYCYASYLMAANSKSTYCARSLAPEDRTMSFLPESQVTLGAATTDCPVSAPPIADKAYYRMLAAPDTVDCDTVQYVFKLYERDFVNGKVIVNATDIPEWYCRYNSRQDTSGYSGMYRLRVEGGDILSGGRFWTESAPNTITLSAGQAAILVNEPIASPTIDQHALYPLYRDGTIPSFIAVRANSWDWTQMWIEVDATNIGGPSRLRLRDDGDQAEGHDLVAEDRVYSSESFVGWSGSVGSHTLPIYARDEDGYATYGTVTVEMMQAPPEMLFENASPASGLEYTGDPSCSASIDGNGDGMMDLVLGMKGEPGYYQQCDAMNGGVPHFMNMTGPAFGGAGVPAGIRSLAIADYDTSRTPDIFAAHDTQPRLYRNNGDGTFADHSVATGLAPYAQKSWTGAWGDYNQDGRPDLVVGRWSWGEQEPDTSQGFREEFYLLKNIANGDDATFVLQNEAAGITGTPRAACTAALWTYANTDSLLDLIIADIKGRSRIYLNLGADDLGQYSFADSTATWFLPSGAGDAAVRCMASMDYDNDKRLDLVVGQWQTGQHCTTIRHNEGNRLMWMFWAVFGQNVMTAVNGLYTMDYDLNGHQDFLVLPAPNEGDIALFANRDPGSIAFQFTDVAAKTGIDGGPANCATMWDANRDGDMELFLGRQKSTYEFFYRSIAVTAKDALERNFVQVRLLGNGIDNSVLGTGALVRFDPMDANADTLQQAMIVDGGGGSPSQQTQYLTYGTGDQSRRVKATVWWPSGRVQVDSTLVTGGAAITRTITEPTAAPAFVSGSVAAQYTALPGGSAIWCFTWRTTEWSNPALDRVVIYDPVTSPPPPPTCHIGTWELRGSQFGVTATIAPSPLGGYLHTLSWQDGFCDPYQGCAYKYRTYSRNGGHETASAERSFSIGACLE